MTLSFDFQSQILWPKRQLCWLPARVTTMGIAHFRCLPMRIWVSRCQLQLLLPLLLLLLLPGRSQRMLMGAGHLQKPFWSVRPGGGEGESVVWHYKNRLLICMTICQVGRTERMPTNAPLGWAEAKPPWQRRFVFYCPARATAQATVESTETSVDRPSICPKTFW